MLKHAVTKHLDSPAPAHFDSTRPGLADHTHCHRIATNLPPGESKGSREVRKLAVLCNSDMFPKSPHCGSLWEANLPLASSVWRASVKSSGLLAAVLAAHLVHLSPSESIWVHLSPSESIWVHLQHVGQWGKHVCSSAMRRASKNSDGHDLVESEWGLCQQLKTVYRGWSRLIHLRILRFKLWFQPKAYPKLWYLADLADLAAGTDRFLTPLPQPRCK